MPERSMCRFITNTLHSVATNLPILLISMVVFIFMPIVLVLSCPLFIWRYIIGKSAQVLNPQLGKIISTQGQLFASDDIFNNPKCNLVVTLTYAGSWDINRFRALVKKTLLSTKLPNGQPRFPELQQGLTSWAGYPFFKKLDNFNLDNHIILNSDRNEKVTDRDINDLRVKLVSKPWDPNQPLWEFILTHNYYPDRSPMPGPHTSVIWRQHHTFGDGLSVLFILIESLADTGLKIPSADNYKRPLVLMVPYYLTLPFRCAWDAAKIYSLAFHLRPWRAKDVLSNKCHVEMSPWIPLKMIRDIKSHFKVSFTSVIFAVFAGSIREIMSRKGEGGIQRLPCITALPVQNHSPKLRNIMTGAVTMLPTGEEDPVKRLYQSHQDYEGIKRSTTPQVVIYTMILSGLYPTWITRRIGTNWLTSVGISNFFVGSEPIICSGHRVLDASFCAGLQGGFAGLGLCALSYVDGYRAAVIVDRSVLSKEDTRALITCFEKQLNILHSMVNQEEV